MDNQKVLSIYSVAVICKGVEQMVQTNQVESIHIVASLGWIAAWFDVSEDAIDIGRFERVVGDLYRKKYPRADVRVDVGVRKCRTIKMLVDVNGEPQTKNTAVDCDNDRVWDERQWVGLVSRHNPLTRMDLGRLRRESHHGVRYVGIGSVTT